MVSGWLGVAFASKMQLSTVVIAFLSKYMTAETAKLILAIVVYLCVAGIVWWMLGLTFLSKLAFLGIDKRRTKGHK